MRQDPSLPPEPLPLTEASVQEIQLELIRRTNFNQFNGRKIVTTLREHRKLWKAVIFDRTGFSKDGISCGSLIKLRDLPTNHWNVDQLFILCDTAGDAHHLAQIATDEQWEADEVQVYENHADRSAALGTSEPGYIVSLWWD